MRAIIGPLAKRHLNGVSPADQWWPCIQCWLGSSVVLQGIRASIAKKPYSLVIFQGVQAVCSPPPPTLPLPPLDPHMHFEGSNCALLRLPLFTIFILKNYPLHIEIVYVHTGQCKRTGGCYNELVVAFFSTGGGVKGKKNLYLLTLLYIYKLAFILFVMTPGAQTTGNIAVYGSAKQLVI